MSLKIGIVGLPNVGKSTLFNALTKKSVPAENYPFCTIDPSVGIVPVPDPRLGQLSTFSNSKKTIPAVIEFVDIAGLVKGASAGEGLGNQFLTHIREVDAIAEMVRVFEDPNVIHVHGKPNPLHDIEVINLELVLADMETVSKRLGNLERDVKRGEKTAAAEKEALEKVKVVLEAGKLARTAVLEKEDVPFVKHMQLLTMKPILYVLNNKPGFSKEPIPKELTDFFASEGAGFVRLDAKTEQELSTLEGEEKEMFRGELGGSEDGLSDLIVQSYKLLGLITYFTTGEDETRAWTIGKGWTAPEAGTAIHTDFKEKFIRAEVVASDALLSSGSYAAAREKGLVRTEGKEYIVKDGDVIEFRI